MKKSLARFRTGSGFTLIELIIAIAIIGILFAFVAPNFGSNIGKAKDSVREATARSVYQALETAQIFGKDLTQETDIAGVLSENGIKFPEGQEICMFWGTGGDSNTGLAPIYVAVQMSSDWKVIQSGDGDITASGGGEDCVAPSVNNASGDPKRVSL